MPENKTVGQEDVQDWEWSYEEQSENDGQEGVDWEWDYIPEDSNESDGTFHNSSLQPLAQNCPIYSGELFFQKQASSSQSLVNSQPMPVLKYHPEILDTASLNEDKDPYQNSFLKD